MNNTEKECTGCLKVLPATTDLFKFIEYKECLNSLCRPCAKKYHAEKSLIFYQQHKQRYLDYGRAKRKVERLTPRGVFNQYKYRSKGLNRPFTLTLEEFSSFWQKPCHYCGDKLETIGLDRIDSSQGYFLDNVVPCCCACNRMKLDMTTSEFISRCIKIVAKWCVTTFNHAFRI